MAQNRDMWLQTPRKSCAKIKKITPNGRNECKIYRKERGERKGFQS